MRRALTGAVAAAVAVGVMGAGGQSVAGARAVVTKYYADLAVRNYAGACTLLAPAYVKKAGRALLASGRDTADAKADIGHPTAANCGRVVRDVIALEKVDITTARAVRIASVHVHGNVATLRLLHVPGAGGGTTSLSAVVTDVGGTWTITSFS